MSHAPLQRIPDPQAHLQSGTMAEIPARSRYQEARVAMAIVAGLRAEGVPIRDIAVVARDLSDYEKPLTREAVRRELPVTFWTQIPLTDTRPFNLVTAVCELLGTPEPSLAEVFAPLKLGWTPRHAEDDWPIPPRTLADYGAEAPTAPRPIQAWPSVLHGLAQDDPRIGAYLNWVADTPQATPKAIGEVLQELVASYRATILPRQQAMDSPALLETETAARAVTKLERIVDQVEAKYGERLDAGRCEQSWRAVAGLCEALANQRPGRREHANALALDVFEANDIWARSIPYIVVVGLIDEDWSQRPWSPLPPESRQRISAGEGRAQVLAPRTAWTGGRNRDQFLDVVTAATTGLVFTRHTRDNNDDPTTRARFLDRIDPSHVDAAARTALLSNDAELPVPIRAMLPTSTTGTEVSTDE